MANSGLAGAGRNRQECTHRVKMDPLPTDLPFPCRPVAPVSPTNPPSVAGRPARWAGALALGLVAGWLASCSTPASSPVPGGGAPHHAAAAVTDLSGEVDVAKAEVVIRFRGATLLTYEFPAGQYKSYVRELHTLRGENVLRDAPSDHLHHHGLMFAVQANGVNFWEERPPAGRQVSEAPPVLSFGRDAAGRAAATLQQVLRWQPAGVDDPAGALLRERRTLVLTADPGVEEVGLTWKSEFEVGPGAERVRLHGADYNGLGMRLPAELDHVAVFQNSAGLPYSEAQTYDVRPAAWSAVSGKVEGREVLLALAAHPRNAGTSTFFSMRNVFAYLAATPSVAKAPIEMERGQKVVMRYELVAYPAVQNGKYLADRFAPFLASP